MFKIIGSLFIASLLVVTQGIIFEQGKVEAQSLKTSLLK